MRRAIPGKRRRAGPHAPLAKLPESKHGRQYTKSTIPLSIHPITTSTPHPQQKPLSPRHSGRLPISSPSAFLSKSFNERKFRLQNMAEAEPAETQECP